MLHKRGHVEVSANPEIGLHKFVVELHAPRNKIAVDLLMPVSELQTALRGKPIIHPSLLARSFASNPAAHDEVIVRIGVVVEKFPIRKLTGMAARGRGVRNNPST